jgi:hypothetical protein
MVFEFSGPRSTSFPLFCGKKNSQDRLTQIPEAAFISDDRKCSLRKKGDWIMRKINNRILWFSAAALSAMILAALCGLSVVAQEAPLATPGQPNFGPNVYVFNPSMS